MLEGSEEHLRSWIPLFNMLASPGANFFNTEVALSIEAYLKFPLLVLPMPNKL